MNPEGDRVPGRAATALILSLFVLSGAAGLVYEIVWTRMLTLVFGNTVHAASTVIASFMGGLAIGSWFFGKMADRRRKRLRLYGTLEAGIGLFALVLPLILRGLNVIYAGLFTAFCEEAGIFCKFWFLSNCFNNVKECLFSDVDGCIVINEFSKCFTAHLRFS